jgi:hypothetical protein
MVTGARYSRAWMQMFLPESLIGAMYHFTKELNMCQLTPTEIIILSAIQLTNACKEEDIVAFYECMLNSFVCLNA